MDTNEKLEKVKRVISLLNELSGAGIPGAKQLAAEAKRRLLLKVNWSKIAFADIDKGGKKKKSED